MDMNYSISTGSFPTLKAPSSDRCVSGVIRLETSLLELLPTIATENSCFSATSTSFRDKSRNPTSHQPFSDGVPVFHRALVGALAGGFAGAFTYACLHPLDTVKTKLQARSQSDVYINAVDAAVKTFRSGGVLGFYSGIKAAVVGSAFSSAVYFGTCEYGKSFLSGLQLLPPLAVPPIAGAMGNIVSSAIMVPKEVVTQRMQTGVAGGVMEVTRQILEVDGLVGLYTGYFATLLRNLPSGMLNYSSFEFLKAELLRRRKKRHLGAVESVCCGAAAGAISAALTTPLDVVKTQLMTGDIGGVSTVAVCGGVVRTLRRILSDEGWQGLARGVGPRVLHSACFSAIGYFSFEMARVSMLQQYRRRMLLLEEGGGGDESTFSNSSGL